LWLKEDGNEGRGILSDLEYAKKPGDGPASSDPKTVSYNICLKLSLSRNFLQGTPFFMALEIMDRRLLYDKPVPEQKLTLGNFNFNEFKSQPLPPRPHVTYNYLHDAESLCWVHLWILLSRIPHPPSQALANNIFQNAGVASPTRRILFLDGIGEQELNQVHPTVRGLVRLWGLPRGGLVRAFRSTLPDKRTDAMYTDVYVSLYALCKWSSETVLALDLTSVRQVDHLTASPSTLRNCSRGPADDEGYVPSEDEGVEKTRLGKRSQPEDSRSTAFVLLPAKKKWSGLS